jgi:predicted DNA-binding protein (MmcQ/YjbR family)
MGRPAGGVLFERTLKRLRAICQALPETSEVEAWGHPTFRAGKRIFATLGGYQGQISLGFKPELATYRRIVEDPRFFIPPYVGHKGWLSLKVEGTLDWDEVGALVLQSYRQFALKRMLDALDERPAAPRKGGGRRRGRRTA